VDGRLECITRGALPAVAGSTTQLKALGLSHGSIRRGIGLCVVAAAPGLALALDLTAASARLEHLSAAKSGQLPRKDAERLEGAITGCLVATVVLAFSGWGLGWGLGRARTRRGQTVFNRLRRQHPLRRTGDLSPVVALYGLDPLVTRGHGALKNFLAPPPPPNPNSSAG
jgi:hypothetical protein